VRPLAQASTPCDTDRMVEFTASDFAGMTVNERLWSAKMIDQWDVAVKARDSDAMLAILSSLYVAAPQRTVDAVLADPGRYGV
jgi:hypothetical protein